MTGVIAIEFSVCCIFVVYESVVGGDLGQPHNTVIMNDAVMNVLVGDRPLTQ
jgi:hypothetical protein